MFNLFVW